MPAWHLLADSASADYVWTCLVDAMQEFGGKRPARTRYAIALTDHRSEGAGMSVPSDIEIARAAKLKPIEAVAERVGIPDAALVHYGRHIAKLDLGWIAAARGPPERPAGAGHRDQPDARPARARPRPRSAWATG